MSDLRNARYVNRAYRNVAVGQIGSYRPDYEHDMRLLREMMLLFPPPPHWSGSYFEFTDVRNVLRQGRGISTRETEAYDNAEEVVALVRRLGIYKGASSGVYRAILDTFLEQGFKYFTDVVVRFGTDAPSESPHDPTLRQVFDRIHAVLHYRSSPMLRMHKGPRSRFLEPGINGITLTMHVDFTEEEIERIHRLNAIHIQ